MTLILLPKITRKSDIKANYRGQGWFMIRGQHELGGIPTKNFDDKLCRNIHVICNHHYVMSGRSLTFNIKRR